MHSLQRDHPTDSRDHQSLCKRITSLTVLPLSLSPLPGPPLLATLPLLSAFMRLFLRCLVAHHVWTYTLPSRNTGLPQARCPGLVLGSCWRLSPGTISPSLVWGNITHHSRVTSSRKPAQASRLLKCPGSGPSNLPDGISLEFKTIDFQRVGSGSTASEAPGVAVTRAASWARGQGNSLQQALQGPAVAQV